MTRLPDLEVVVLRFDRVPYMDQSGLYALEEAVMDLRGSGIRVVFTDIHGQPRDLAERIRLIPNLVPAQFCFDTFRDCATWLEQYLSGDPPEPSIHGSEPNGEELHEAAPTS
jgi:SulP family sulfate permease